MKILLITLFSLFGGLAFAQTQAPVSTLGCDLNIQQKEELISKLEAAAKEALLGLLVKDPQNPSDRKKWVQLTDTRPRLTYSVEQSLKVKIQALNLENSSMGLVAGLSFNRDSSGYAPGNGPDDVFYQLAPWGFDLAAASLTLSYDNNKKAHDYRYSSSSVVVYATTIELEEYSICQLDTVGLTLIEGEVDPSIPMLSPSTNKMTVNASSYSRNQGQPIPMDFSAAIRL